VLYPLFGVILETVGAAADAGNREKLTEVEFASGTVTIDELSKYPVNFKDTVRDPAATLVNVYGVTEYVFTESKKIVAPAGEELTEIFPSADTPAGTSRRMRQTKSVNRFMPILPNL